MTERKITFGLKKIGATRKAGYHLEALLRHYHLNIELMRFILARCSEHYHLRDRKVKLLVRDFIREHATNTKMKAVINKNSLKSVKLWLEKMDLFFKGLKMGQPREIPRLYSETEKIFTLLNIPASKLFASSRK